MKKILISLLLMFPLVAAAQYAQPVPNPPDIPPQMQSGEPLEPEISIIERKDEVITEYRTNGELYKVKVQPAVGPAYYYVDMDGDGLLEFHRDDPYSTVAPQWLIYRW